MTQSHNSSAAKRPARHLLLGGLVALFLIIMIVSFGEGTYKGWRISQDSDRMGWIGQQATQGFDLLYGRIKYSIYGQIFGFALSLCATGLTFLIAQVLFSRYGMRHKLAERIANAGALVWVFAAFNWISAMPIGFVAAAVLLIFVGLNNARRWLPVLIDETTQSSRSVLFVYLSLLILNGFFWWPGYQLFCALGIAGTVVGDNVAALFGKAHGKRKFRFNKAGKTLEGTVAMFVATLAFNMLIAHLMIHIPGFQKELFRLLIIGLAAGLSTATEAFSPKGMDNILIGPITAFPIYFYIH